MRYTQKQSRAITLEMVYAITIIFIGTVLALSLQLSDLSSYTAAVIGLETIAAAGLALQLYIYVTDSRRHVLKSYLIAAVASAAIIIAAVVR